MKKVADFVKKYRGMGYTCAESTLMAANEAWELNLPDESLAMMGGFGGGMHCGNVCGAISGGVAALSSRYNSGSGHSSPLLTVKCKLFVTTVEERTGHYRCDELAPIYRTPEENCDPTVVLIAGILDEIEAVEINIPEETDYDLRFPPEGKKGFLDFYNEAKAQLDSKID